MEYPMAKAPHVSVGFVGLGNMGAPMVRCLVRAGHPVVAYDTRPGIAAGLAAESACEGRVHIAADLADVGLRTNLVITMLPDSKIVRAVVMGRPNAPGLAASLTHGSVVVDMSSSYPLDTRALAKDIAAAGIDIIDAPVSGGVGRAIMGTLAIMAGGDTQVLDRVAPMLSAMGTVHRTGGLGSGHAIKALNNYVSAAGLLATCEALAIAESFELDPKTVIDVINASTGKNNTTEHKAGRYLIPRNYTSGFALALMEKDVGMARALANDLGVDAEALEFVSQFLRRASVTLGADADHTAIMALAAQPGRLNNGRGDTT
jgi:3-hydroxyisobutyrate dehydrogenase